MNLNLLDPKFIMLGGVESYGGTPVVVYRPAVAERKHGNFLDTSYQSILNHPGWTPLLLNHLSGASTVSFLLNHAILGSM
jgi:hypothetical protein